MGNATVIKHCDCGKRLNSLNAPVGRCYACQDSHAETLAFASKEWFAYWGFTHSRTRPPGEKRGPRHRLTPAEQQEIRDLLASGLKKKQVMNLTGRSWNAILTAVKKADQ